MFQPDDTVPSPHQAGIGRRYNRSRHGCLTCKRRKVKCDEQRPRCSHCERLNLECKWRPHHAAVLPRQQQQQDGNAGALSSAHQQSLSPTTDQSSGTSTSRAVQAMDEVFDYASFLWDPGSNLWQQASPDMSDAVGLGANSMGAGSYPNGQNQPSTTGTYADTPIIEDSRDQPINRNADITSQKLMEFFVKCATPPILAGVESHRKWLSIRQILATMAKSSRVLHCAILAFSNSLLSRRDLSWALVEQNHYEEAAAVVATYDSEPLHEQNQSRECLLAALFFLSYVDIIESRIDAAHDHLKRAYNVFQQGNRDSFSHIEKQILLWIRLLDARAVSAGGEGLFLTQGDEIDLVEPSPTSFEAEADDMSKGQDVIGDDIEDVLFQALYQPGIVFYQKVQSFMGRISKIDPWHRSRGTVEDEIEVMNIGAAIAADLRALYDQRPPLMDYAVAGKLSEPHVSTHLAFTITRAFRTYLSNYYASKVHLHRVAFKHLPLTKEATSALDHIRKLARQIASDLGSEDSLPVNMLWPLLMLGVEEQDDEEKTWIKAQILRMERVAGNARITAQVLEEVQARQDTAKARVDIRSVMHSVFNSCFAIV